MAVIPSDGFQTESSAAPSPITVVGPRPTIVQTLAGATLVVKNAPGNLSGFVVTSRESVGAWVSIFRKASAPVNGDTPFLSFQLPGNGTATSPSILGLDESFFGEAGMVMTTGIAIAIATANGNLTIVTNTANYDIAGGWV